ncbi:hypothetical protein QTO34_013213, partial [Cnephaeus nilssonii]
MREGNKHGKCIDTYQKIINFVRSQSLNQPQFTAFLSELDSEYSGLSYYTEVHWLSCSKVLKQFWDLKEEIYQIITNMCDQVKAFKCKLVLRGKQLKNEDLMHFPTCNMNKSSLALDGGQMVVMRVRLPLVWSRPDPGAQLHPDSGARGLTRTWDPESPGPRGAWPHPDPGVRAASPGPGLQPPPDPGAHSLTRTRGRVASPGAGIQPHLDAGARARGLTRARDPASSGPRGAWPLLDPGARPHPDPGPSLTSDSDLKAKFNDVGVPEFYKYLPNGFENTRKFTYEIISMFGSTYWCEQLFTVMKGNKSPVRSRITDTYLESVLKVITANKISPEVGKIAEKRCH